jgi:hypothetical protein
MRRLATWRYLLPVLLAGAQVLAQGSDNVQVRRSDPSVRCKEVLL